MKIPVGARLEAVRRLTSSRDKRVPGLLERLLKDNWVVVRSAAVTGVATMQVKALAPELCRMVTADSSPEVRRTAAHALSHLREVSGIQPILQMGADHPRSEAVALEYVARLGSLAVPTLASCLAKGPSEPIAILAIKALGRIASTEAIHTLLDALFSCPGSLRLPILQALASCDLVDTGLRLVPLLADSGPEIRGSALNLLSLYPTNDATAAVLKQLSSSDPDHRRLACRALRRSTTHSVESSLIKSLTDRSPAVRAAAAATLGELESQAAFHPLLQTLSDSDSQPKIAALKSLGELRLPDAVPHILPFVDHDEMLIRLQAVTALGMIGNSSTVSRLVMQLASEPELEVRQAVVRALGQIGDSSALPALEPLLVEASPLRLPAVVAIAAIGTPPAMEILLPLTQDHSEQVRYHAVMALCQMGTESVLPVLARVLESANPSLLSAMSRNLSQWKGRSARELAQRAETMARTRIAAARAAQLQSPQGKADGGNESGLLVLSHKGASLAAVATGLMLLIGGTLFWGNPFRPKTALSPNKSPASQGHLLYLAQSPKGGAITISSTGSVREWTASGQVPVINNQLSIPNAVYARFSGTFNLLALANFQGEIRVQRFPAGNEVLRIPGRGNSIRRIWFNTQETAIAVWSLQDGIRAWDLQSREMLMEYTAGPGEQWHAAALNSDFSRLAIAPQAGRVTIINPDKRKLLGFCGESQQGVVSALEFSSDDDAIAVAETSGKLKLFEVKSRRLLSEIESTLPAVRELQFSKSGRLLTGCGVGGVFAYDLQTGKAKISAPTVSGVGRTSEWDVVDFLAIDISEQFLFGGASDSPMLLKWKLPQLGRPETVQP